jgi:indole-3-glycerol phosphate synthase
MSGGGVLDEILSHKRSELAARQSHVSMGELQARCGGLAPALDFEAALRPRAGERVRLIAEVKKASPSAGVLNAALDPVTQARAYAGAGAAAISVLTDEKYFRGSLDDLVAVRAAVSAPLLRKEFIVDEYQLWESRAAGADAVLLIVAALDPARLRDLMQAAKEIGLATLVEVHAGAELDAALRADAPVIGVNNRDLRTLRTSLEPSLALLPLIPPGHVAVSESGIASGADVERVVAAGAHAILVGEGLVRASDVSTKVRELLLG